MKFLDTSQRFTGILFEKWLKYWRNVYTDYKGVVVDIHKECKSHPIKAFTYFTAAGCVYYGTLHNPSEIMFREQLISNTSKLVMVGKEVRNPVSAYYLKWLQQNYNEGIIRRLNFGIISILWLDNYSYDCALYKATCSHLKPQYWTFNQRIIDIGFLDNWWILTNYMKNYDVNDYA